MEAKKQRRQANTERTRVRRIPDRGHYDRAAIDPILDEALIGHVGFSADSYVTVIPTAIWRVEDRLFIHGSSASRMIRGLSAGAEACITVTLMDGLVMARSGFHHSMNYRSVVVFGKATVIEEAEEKEKILFAFMEKIAPGRWDEVRPPNQKELRATAVLGFDLTEASAKIRTGPPIDDEEDYALPVWAGVVPLCLTSGDPVPDPRMTSGAGLPSYLSGYRPDLAAQKASIRSE